MGAGLEFTLSLDLKKNSYKFKTLFASVSNVLIHESRSKNSKINLNKPLLWGCKIQHNGKEVWTEFKYENLAIFCFYCGRVGQA